MNKRLLRRTVFGSVAVGALVISGAAQAQDADTESEDVLEIIDEAPQEEARQEKIVVTGSLLARDEFSSSSPIQVITAEVATLEGLVDTAALLQGSSLASGSTQLNNTFQNFVTNGGVGTQTLDLRGCGDTRTLVLVDGKRPVAIPGNALGADTEAVLSAAGVDTAAIKTAAGRADGCTA